MNIGFDAKRTFHNNTGLGNYSRSLVTALSEYYPEHQYFLFNPVASSLFPFVAPNMYEVQPSSFFHKIFTGIWRSNWVRKDLKKNKIDLYHGLSHEIPIGIQHTGIKSVVTIHDLIHERYPEQYSFIDAAIYRKKFRNACKYADKVIAISEQTKKDIMEFYKIPGHKISVCYQSCSPAFMESVRMEEKKKVKEVYNLPDEYFLYVGSIIERKNLLNICKAVHLLRKDFDVPLVIIGEGGKYKQMVKEYVKQNDLESRVIFLSDKHIHKSVRYNYKLGELEELENEILEYNEKGDIPEELGQQRLKLLVQLEKYEKFEADFPAIYQSAIALIYPSFFEGFGIPVLEALWSRLPVIISHVAGLPEAGGKGADYVNPDSVEEIAVGMKKIYTDKQFATDMIEKGWQHAQKFTPKKHAEAVMNVYRSI